MLELFMTGDCAYNFKKAKRIKQIDLFILTIIFLLSMWAILGYKYFSVEIQQEIGSYGLIAVFVAVLLLEFIPQMLHPFICVVMAVGAGINLILAVIVASIASTVGSIAGYWVGKKYGFNIVCPLFNQKTIQKTLKLWDRHAKEYVLLSALTPLPYLPLIFGALGLKKRYMFFWGIIPRIIGYATMGWLLYYGIHML